MTDPVAPPPRTRCPIWVRVVLGLSLALNLLIIGLVAGFVLRGGPVASNGGGLSYAAPYIIALDRSDRRAVLAAIRSDPTLPDRRARRAQFAEMLTALRADPIDIAQVQAILDRQARATSRVQAVAQATWLARVQEMSVADRRAYADGVENVLKRGPRRRNRPPRP
ncbi:MAG: periplasmic heavy metal sensor [Pseudomonadota bacterium]